MRNKTINKKSLTRQDKRFSALLNLLEDENSDIASLAISELLSYGKDFEPILSELQESPNIFIRQRVHQLQAIINIRKNRENFIKKLNNKYSGLWSGLNELHLLWYDNDNFEELRCLKKSLLNKALNFKPSTLNKLAEFMRDMTFVSSPEGNLEPDYYCIGSVLDSKIGSDFILCSIAKSIADYFNFETKVVFNKESGFALIDNQNNMLSPINWIVKNNINSADFETWFPGMLLKHALLQLYLCAISADSYRYVYSIGSCLAKALKAKDIFPYPYNFI